MADSLIRTVKQVPVMKRQGSVEYFKWIIILFGVNKVLKFK